MSTQVTVTGGTTQPSHECQYEDDGETPHATVTVGGSRLPIINEGVRTEIRKDEAMSLTRHSEVYFPTEWNGTDYSDVVQALDPDRANVYDPVDIHIKDYVTGELRLVHRGFVMGVGGGSRGNIERRLTVGDVGQLLGAIPFEGEYDPDANLETVVDDCLDQLRDILVPTVFDAVTKGERTIDTSNFEGTDGDGGIGIPLPPIAVAIGTAAQAWTEGSDTNKTFHADEHSVADALHWAEEKMDGIFYFTGTERNDITLVYDEQIGVSPPRLTATHLDDGNDVHVYKNNALHEITPLNTLEVTGKRNDDGEYPRVIVGHEDLRQRSNMPLTDKISVDTETRWATEQTAKRELKKRIDTGSLGQLVAAPSPTVQPYTIVKSLPACGQNVETGIPLSYEVEELVHYISAKRPDENRRKHETQMRVSMARSYDDIRVYESTMEQTTPDDKSAWERIKDAFVDPGQSQVG